MEEGGRRLEMEMSEAGKVFVSEVLLVNSGGLEVLRVSSLMGRERQKATMERSTLKRIILAHLQKICDREVLDLWQILQIVFLNFQFRICQNVHTFQKTGTSPDLKLP